MSAPTHPAERRSPLSIVVLFALTLGAYWPIRMHAAYEQLGAGPGRATRLTPRAATLLELVPAVNLLAPVYLAIDLPRALRRRRAGDGTGPDPELLSILLAAPVAGGVAVAVLLGLSIPLTVLLAGYLAWIFNLPAALALERALPPAVGPHRRETRLALGVAAVVLAATVVIVVAGGDDEQRGPSAAQPKPAEVSDIAVTREALWITNTVRGTVLKLDRRTKRMLAPPIRVGLEPLDIAAGEGAVWVASYQSGTVARIDPASNRVTRRIPTGRGPFGVAVGRGSVWVSNQVERTVTRIDPRTSEVEGPSPTVGRGPRGVAVGEGAVWTADGEGRSVSQVLPGEQRARRVRLGRFAHDVAAGAGSVWVTIPEDGFVRRIDPKTLRLEGAAITVPDGPSSIEVGLGVVWVAGERGTVTRLDPRTGRLSGAPVDVHGQIADLTVGEDAAWVLRADGSVRRIPGPRR